MWNEILNERDIQEFMDKVGNFHDSCVKEMRYCSGAYVDDDLSMYPINDSRTLDVILQRQVDELSMIDMQFIGLKYLNLCPFNEEYTAEILNSRMFLKDGYICWSDSEDFVESGYDGYEGTFVCAARLRWRIIDDGMGNEDFYITRSK